MNDARLRAWICAEQSLVKRRSVKNKPFSSEFNECLGCELGKQTTVTCVYILFRTVLEFLYAEL